jgi:hypothetical protein
MALEGFAERLARTPASAALVDHFWVVPSLQSIHIIAVAFVLTGTVVLTGRAWNLLGAEWSTMRWGRRLLPGMWGALAVLLVTGSMLVLAEPTRELPNWSFRLKMALLLFAVPLTWWLARRIRRERASRVGPATKAIGALLVLLWLAIIAAARWIGYT